MSHPRFKAKQTSILKQWVAENYSLDPSKEQMLQLQESTGLLLAQISGWFRRKRRERNNRLTKVPLSVHRQYRTQKGPRVWPQHVGHPPKLRYDYGSAPDPLRAASTIVPSCSLPPQVMQKNSIPHGELYHIGWLPIFSFAQHSSEVHPFTRGMVLPTGLNGSAFTNHHNGMAMPDNVSPCVSSGLHTSIKTVSSDSTQYEPLIDSYSMENNKHLQQTSDYRYQHAPMAQSPQRLAPSLVGKFDTRAITGFDGVQNAIVEGNSTLQQGRELGNELGSVNITQSLSPNENNSRYVQHPAMGFEHVDETVQFPNHDVNALEVDWQYDLLGCGTTIEDEDEDKMDAGGSDLAY